MGVRTLGIVDNPSLKRDGKIWPTFTQIKSKADMACAQTKTHIAVITNDV